MIGKILLVISCLSVGAGIFISLPTLSNPDALLAFFTGIPASFVETVAPLIADPVSAPGYAVQWLNDNKLGASIVGNLGCAAGIGLYRNYKNNAESTLQGEITEKAGQLTNLETEMNGKVESLEREVSDLGKIEDGLTEQIKLNDKLHSVKVTELEASLKKAQDDFASWKKQAHIIQNVKAQEVVDKIG